MKVLITFFLTVNLFANIISSAPSITEMVYFLGLGDQLVGVTPYCNYPLEAKKKEKIGSAYSLNFESILKLKPSLVLLSNMKGSKNKAKLDELGIESLTLSHESIEDIRDSLLALNSKFKLKKEGKVRSLFKFNQKLKNSLKVLIIIDEKMRSGRPISLRVATKKTYYGQILQRMGAVNAFDSKILYPVIGQEGILNLKYDYAIRVGATETRSKVLKKWKESKDKYKVSFYLNDEAIIPGPRLQRFYQELFKLFNQELKF